MPNVEGTAGLEHTVCRLVRLGQEFQEGAIIEVVVLDGHSILAFIRHVVRRVCQQQVYLCSVCKGGYVCQAGAVAAEQAVPAELVKVARFGYRICHLLHLRRRVPLYIIEGVQLIFCEAKLTHVNSSGVLDGREFRLQQFLVPACELAHLVVCDSESLNLGVA